MKDHHWHTKSQLVNWEWCFEFWHGTVTTPLPHHLNPGIHGKWVWLTRYVMSRGEKQKCIPLVRAQVRLNGFEVVGRHGHHSSFLNNFIFQPVNLIPLQLFSVIFIFYIEKANGSEVLLGLLQRVETNEISYWMCSSEGHSKRLVWGVQILSDWLCGVGFGHYIQWYNGVRMRVSKCVEVFWDILPLANLAPYVATLEKWFSHTSCLSQIMLLHMPLDFEAELIVWKFLVWSLKQCITQRKLWPLCMQGELCPLHCSISMFFLSLKNFIFSGALYCKTF